MFNVKTLAGIVRWSREKSILLRFTMLWRLCRRRHPSRTSRSFLSSSSPPPFFYSFPFFSSSSSSPAPSLFFSIHRRKRQLACSACTSPFEMPTAPSTTLFIDLGHYLGPRCALRSRACLHQRMRCTSHFTCYGFSKTVVSFVPS